jgi:hypothetical protein
MQHLKSTGGFWSRFFSHRRDHRQYRHWEPVTLEDGTVEFRPTIGTLAVEAAFAEIFGPQPEDGE